MIVTAPRSKAGMNPAGASSRKPSSSASATAQSVRAGAQRVPILGMDAS
jgi:hypothetical protein